MSPAIRTFAFTLLLGPAVLRAQVPATPSGHWEGAIRSPRQPVNIAIDISRGTDGVYAATFTNAAGTVKGLPLYDVRIDARAVHLVLRANSGGGTFDGVLSDDGTTLSGNFVTQQQGASLPFSLTRNGEAHVEAAARSPAVAKEFEGTWNGVIATDDGAKHVIVTLANQPDGTVKGMVNSVDEGVLLPMSVVIQRGTSLTLKVASVNGVFEGTLNAAGTEIAGQWTLGTNVFQLTLKRSDS